MKWTPTSREMPGNMRFVWVTVERPGSPPRVFKGWWDRDQWRLETSIGQIPLAYDERITAFMDIPTCPLPYKENV